MKKSITRFVKIGLGIVAFCLSTSGFAQWEIVGTEGFSSSIADYTSIGLDESTPYIIFSDASKAGKATVMKYSGTSWDIVGSAGISINQITLPTIQIVSGTPYISYYENKPGVPAFSVKKWNGTDWEVIGNASTLNAIGGYFKINNGVPYIATGFSLYKYNGISWEKVNDYTSLSGFGGGSPTLDFDGTTPYIAYTASSKLFVVKYNGSTFEQVGNEVFSAGAAGAPKYVSLAISNGTPYVAYEDASQGKKVTVSKFNGTTWETVGNAGFSSGEVIYTSLKFNGGTPYVAYGDKGNDTKATVKKFIGTSWETLGANGLSSGGAGFTSLAIDATNNTLFIAYQDFPQTGKATVQKYKDVVSSIAKEEFLSKENGVYPNPTTGKLFLNLNPDSYLIFNTLGLEVEKGAVSENSIDVSHLVNGVYNLQLSHNGTTSRTKFIKQ